MHRNFNGRNQHVKLSQAAISPAENKETVFYIHTDGQHQSDCNSPTEQMRKTHHEEGKMTHATSQRDHVPRMIMYKYTIYKKNKLGEITIKEICTRLAGNIYMVKESMQHSHKC